MADFISATNEMTPMFGKVSDEINEITSTPFIIWSDNLQSQYDSILETIKSLAYGHMYNILITGKSYIGKTKFVAHVAKQTNIPCIRIVTPDKLLKVSDKSLYITNVFSQCQKSESSILILDNMERIIEWSSMGSRFNNQILQTIMTLLRSQMKKKSRMIVLCTSNKKEVLEDLELFDLFDNHYEYPTTIMEDDAIKHFSSIRDNIKFLSGIANISDVFRLMKFY
jgi:vesicle-fusing ATPase